MSSTQETDQVKDSSCCSASETSSLLHTYPIVCDKEISVIINATIDSVVKSSVQKESPDSVEKPVEKSSEKDTPVRRSTRIRRSVISKDETAVNRSSGKKTKNAKASSAEQSSSSNLTEENMHKKSGSSTTDENKSASGEKNMDIKSPKSNKRLQKKLSQNSKKSDIAEKKVKSEKQKQSYKRKKADNVNSNEGTTNTSSVDNLSVIDSDPLSVPQSLASTCAKVLNITPVSEAKPSDDTNNLAKNDEQNTECEKPSDSIIRPVKVKSRWWRSSELEGVLNTSSSDASSDVATVMHSSHSVPVMPSMDSGQVISVQETNNDDAQGVTTENDALKVEVENNPQNADRPIYEHIEENIYRFARKKCKSKKQVRRMVCDCTLTKEEQERGMLGCQEECLNRLLMIECGSRCPLGEACSNKKFQKKEYVKAETFKTEKKGWGLRSLENIPVGEFLMEFVGEVLNHKEYRQRVKQYAKEKVVHSYFMALKTDEILDATSKGNLTRFINHSCDPNCETQKWTVNGELRVGVFAKRFVKIGEELTLDYKFQRYGREAQKCFCGSENCSGFIGGAKQISIDAYSGGRASASKKRKGSDDKKQEEEDMILEEEIEKLNGNKGLRNREETLKLARLMVQADEPNIRHKLLDIIIKTEQQACLRLFLDYHGLPLLWSWMTDVVDFDLKSKILQVLGLLPVSNKTMLLDSKVLNMVQKWCDEYNLDKSDCVAETLLSPPVFVGSNEDTSEPVTKKLKLPDFSDSESDSISSQNASENTSESSNTANENSAGKTVDETLSESLKETSSQAAPDSERKSPDMNLKISIFNSAKELLNSWKNLKEVFRIPRLEQQKRKEDEIEADHSVLKNLEPEVVKPQEPEPAGDHIQVLISGKTQSYPEPHKTFEFPSQNNIKTIDTQESRKKLLEPPADIPRKTSLPTGPPMSKQARRHLFAKRMDEEALQRKLKEVTESAVESPSSCGNPPPHRSALLPTPPLCFPPPVSVPVAPLPHVDPSSQVMYPSSVMYPPQSQVPFPGVAPPPVLPHPPTAIPPPSTIISQPPPMLQQPPPNVGMPPCQPINTPQPNINLPPNPSNYLLPPNMPPTSAVPGSSAPPFIPCSTSAVPNFPPGPNIFGNQNQPLYYMPPPTGLTSSAPAASFPESVPAQVSVTMSAPPTVPAVKEDPKPKKLPKNWRTATDSEGNVYYYHSVTRQTQWDPPSEEQIEEESDEEQDSESDASDSDTPTYDEPKVWPVKRSKRKSKKRKTTKAAADTSVAFPVRPEIAKKIKELFRTKMSTFIIGVLNSYRKPDCAVGRITNNDDFKYLARKLTHYTMTKELKQCKNVEDLDCNETVMHKARDFIKKYMSKYGSHYVRKDKDKSSPTTEEGTI